MVRTVALVLLALGPGVQDAKDPAEAAKARKARINELRKELSSGGEAARIQALQELGGIHESDARSLIIDKMTTDTDAVRRAAAKAIILHRKPICAKALGNAIQANGANDALVKFLIETLGELDMCASIPILTAILQGKATYAEEVFKALVAIGCPEAAPALAGFLKRAEAEARKPDFFEDIGGGTYGGRTGVRTENRNKDKVLAALVPSILETLQKVTGVQHDSYREWSAVLQTGAGMPKLTSQHYCEEADKTYDIPSGKPSKCPHSTKSGHEDVFLKHRRE